MLKAYRRSDVRRAEAARVAQLPVDALMKKAAEAVAQAALELVSENPRSRKEPLFVGLVGGGDNGGDALYALSFLADAGYSTRAVLLHRTPYRRAALAAKNAGVELVSVDLTADPKRQWSVIHSAVSKAQVWIDGLVGTGLQGSLREPLSTIVKRLVRLREVMQPSVKIVAVDLPSGLAADDGTLSEVFLPATVTVTMGAVKSSALLPPSCFAWGRIKVVDLGLKLSDPVCYQLTANRVGENWLVPGPNDHKYTRGVPLVLAGSHAYPLTGVMCVEAAGRAGAGLVRYCGPNEASLAILSRFPEAVMVQGQYQSLLVGPGLDTFDEERVQEALSMLKVALSKQLPVVLDAGAFAFWSQIEGLLSGGEASPNVVLTPHSGEAARLANHYGFGRGQGGISRLQVEQNPVFWANVLANKTGATIVLKGAATVVASPDLKADGFSVDGGLSTSTPLYVQREAPGWAGTAGSGDVLAGILVAALAGQGARAEEQGQVLSSECLARTAACAVWVHGTAARLAAGMPPIPEFLLSVLGDTANGFLRKDLEGLSESSTVSWVGKPITASDIISQIPSAISLALATVER